MTVREMIYVLAWIVFAFSCYMIYALGWATFAASIIPWIVFMILMWGPVIYFMLRR